MRRTACLFMTTLSRAAEILISRLQQPGLPWRRRLVLLKVNAVLWLAHSPGHEVLVQVTQCGSRTPRCSFARTAKMNWAASRRQTGACVSHSYWHLKLCARRHFDRMLVLKMSVYMWKFRSSPRLELLLFNNWIPVVPARSFISSSYFCFPYCLFMNEWSIFMAFISTSCWCFIKLFY